MDIIKFLHFTGLMLGATAGLGGLLLALGHKRAGGGTPAPVVKQLKPLLGQTGLAGLVLLWITGTILTGQHDFAALGGWFHAKLTVAAVMLGMSLWANWQIIKSRKTGTPPPAYMDLLSRSSAILAMVAVALAVAVFH